MVKLERCRKPSIAVHADNNAFCSLDGVLYSKDQKILICYPENKAGSRFNIPDGVERIERLENHNLREVIFPNSITEICSGAFHGCKHLGKLIFPPKLTIVQNMLFWGDRFLTEVTIPRAVQIIEEDAFYMCPNLADLYYEGTREQWEDIAIDQKNGDLYSGRVALHFVDGTSIRLLPKQMDPFMDY